MIGHNEMLDGPMTPDRVQDELAELRRYCEQAGWNWEDLLARSRAVDGAEAIDQALAVARGNLLAALELLRDENPPDSLAAVIAVESAEWRVLQVQRLRDDTFNREETR
jgi:hypothetical protein